MPRPWPHRTASLVLAGLALLGPMAAPRAQAADAPASDGVPVQNSALDGRLMYQLLLAEIVLNQGDAGTAYQWVLDAARRTQDETLFRRATDIALQARAGEQALVAIRAWRAAVPASVEPLRMQLQVLVAMGRVADLGEPMAALLTATPEAERTALIASLPTLSRRLREPSDKAALAEQLRQALQPWRDARATGSAARVAEGRAWLEAGQADRALALAREAQAPDARALGPALLALEAMRRKPEAETLVRKHLASGAAEPALRLAFVRTLVAMQRYGEALGEAEDLARAQPEMGEALLVLGGLQVELKQLKAGEATLQRYIALAQRDGMPAAPASPASAGATGDDEDEDDAGQRPRSERGLMQARMMLAQVAEQRGDYTTARALLDQITDPAQALEVQVRRASILARQGRLEQARALLRAAPEKGPADQRAKLLAELGLLRDAKQWRSAHLLLAEAIRKQGEADADLLYEHAMLAEKLDRVDEMERLLRRVIELRPDNPHAYNALGYSLADRGLRLPEARDLIRRALELAPGDPFITDSLGWVEFRMGRIDEAAVLLRQAYRARPDPEIGAHLGEVLWARGQRDEARSIWREVRGRDADNDVLRETLKRLRVDP